MASPRRRAAARVAAAGGRRGRRSRSPSRRLVAGADSARIVHGLHASLLALGVRAWFEYVRTDANVSDKPSREDLSTACYALGEVMGEAITGRLDSVPVGSVLPDVSDWRDPAAAWIGF